MLARDHCGHFLSLSRAFHFSSRGFLKFEEHEKWNALLSKEILKSTM